MKKLQPFNIEAPPQLVAGELRLFSKLEIIFCQKIISLTHLSPLVGLIPFIGVRKFVDSVRSPTPPQAAGNALAVQFKLYPWAKGWVTLLFVLFSIIR